MTSRCFTGELATHNHGGSTATAGSHNHGATTGNAGGHTRSEQSAGYHNHPDSNGNNYTTYTNTDHYHSWGANTGNENCWHQHEEYSGRVASGTGGVGGLSPAGGTDVGSATGSQNTLHYHGVSGTTTWQSQTYNNGNHTHAIYADGSHTHTINGVSDHAHSITSDGTHSHTISNDGSGTAHNNMQPSLVLNHIIRIA